MDSFIAGRSTIISVLRQYFRNTFFVTITGLENHRGSRRVKANEKETMAACYAVLM
jgi:hypothetical protein